MAILNPNYRYIIITPILLIIAIPAIGTALLTTLIALLILLYRTFALAIDFILSLVPYYFSKRRSKSDSKRPPLHHSRFSFNSKTNSRRRASSLSPKCTTPSKSFGFNLGLDASRDYEGLGGWRLSQIPDEQEILWESINSRLELPCDHGRLHRGSLTPNRGPEPL